MKHLVVNATRRNLYRTQHPFHAVHDGFDWPARPANYPIAPNTGSFDVYSRLLTLPNSTSDGGKIQVTSQQWGQILKKNNYSPLFTKWAVGGTDKIMMWPDGGSVIPAFHYPLVFGGNFVDVLDWNGPFAKISTWPKDRDVPDDLPDIFWHRCWSVYASADPERRIRDAPAGPGGEALRCWMLALAHSDSAWIHGTGLIK